ncbi:complement factor H-related protein 4-like [Homarus americanus]|uniref:complement factor H-related protein 4-like n=1 Tax=Homarus americanus TaxID=6706 RepID=UPI001C48B2C4|nr:complement factor H-related protein 4-like [Homarus americanus]
MGGMYSPDVDIMEALNDTTSHSWRVLRLSVASPENFTLIPAPLMKYRAPYAVCQYPGPIGCSDDPPSPGQKMTRTWTGDTAVSTTAQYTCSRGYFVEGCAGEPIVANASTAWSNTVIWKEGMTLVFTCVDGYITDPDNTTGVLTCNTTGWTTRDECYEACAQEPTIANATTVWVNTETWTEGMTVLFTCIESFLTDAGSNTGVINCSLTGWRTDDVCYKVCVAEPVVTNAVVNWTNTVMWKVGMTVTFTCVEGYIIEVENNTGVVTCTETGWTTPDLCYEVCLGNPPRVPSFTYRSWENYDRRAGTQVVYTCLQNLLMGNMEQTYVVTCKEDGNWTTADPDILQCRSPAPAPPPPTPYGATLESKDANFWVHSIINYTCREDQMSPTGVRYFIIECRPIGWTLLDPEFACHNST